MRHRRNGYFRTCRIALTERDELAFSRALVERFGRMYCFPRHPFPTADVPMAHTLGGIPGDEFYVCVAAGGWEPAVRPCVISRAFLGYSWDISPFYFHYFRSHWSDGPPNPKWAFDPPCLQQTEIYGYVAHADPMKDAVEAFLMDVFKCLGKAGRGRARAGGRIWGHDAIRDVLARGARAAIDGGYRPKEHWKFPEKSPYYRDELWDDNPSSIIPYEIRGSKTPRIEVTAAEYNAQHNSHSEFSAKAPVRARNKLGNLRLE